MCLPVLLAGAGGRGLLAAADCDGIVSQLEDGDWRPERRVCTAAGRGRVLQLLLTARTRHESTKKPTTLYCFLCRIRLPWCPLVDEKSNCLHVVLILS